MPITTITAAAAKKYHVGNGSTSVRQRRQTHITESGLLQWGQGFICPKRLRLCTNRLRRVLRVDTIRMRLAATAARLGAFSLHARPAGEVGFTLKRVREHKLYSFLSLSRTSSLVCPSHSGATSSVSAKSVSSQRESGRW